MKIIRRIIFFVTIFTFPGKLDGHLTFSIPLASNSSISYINKLFNVLRYLICRIETQTMYTNKNVNFTKIELNRE